MSNFSLNTFWFETPGPSGPVGFGVTATSVVDAIEIIQSAGYDLPRDGSNINAQIGIKPAEIKHDYVQRNMGPTDVRGLWYPISDRRTFS